MGTKEGIYIRISKKEIVDKEIKISMHHYYLGVAGSANCITNPQFLQTEEIQGRNLKGSLLSSVLSSLLSAGT